MNSIFYCSSWRNCNWKQLQGSLSQISARGRTICGTNTRNEIFCTSASQPNPNTQLPKCDANFGTISYAQYTGKDELKKRGLITSHQSNDHEKTNHTLVRRGKRVGGYRVLVLKHGTRLAWALMQAYLRWLNNNPLPNGGQGHGNDGTVFGNKEGLLPTGVSYTEWGINSNRGWGCSFTNNERLVMGSNGQGYYSPDHYRSFILVPGSFWKKN
jgi:hypothetical protein